MTRETIYLVQPFKAGKGTRLAADTPIRCKSPDGARRTAERLALTKAGAVAFATSGDAESGESTTKNPTIHFQGRPPRWLRSRRHEGGPKSRRASRHPSDFSAPRAHAGRRHDVARSPRPRSRIAWFSLDQWEARPRRAVQRRTPGTTRAKPRGRASGHAAADQRSSTVRPARRQQRRIAPRVSHDRPIGRRRPRHYAGR